MKFKVGDRVKIKGRVLGLVSQDAYGIIGTIIHVKKDSPSAQPYLVKTDTKHTFLHTGEGRVQQGHGVWINDLEAELLPEDSFIVVKRTYDGQLLPSHKPHQHETRVSAENEAVRLAKQNLMNDFVVFQMVTEVKTPVIPEPDLIRHT